MKQSSIEYVVDQLIEKDLLMIYGKPLEDNDLIEIIKQAKLIHKREMIDFAYNCRNLMAGDEFAITHWYDKTFNTKEK